MPKSTTFSDEQYARAYPDGSNGHFWHHARNGILSKELGRTCGPTTPVLEVGCGRGLVVKALRKRGFAVDGVELARVRPDRDAAKFVITGLKAEELPEKDRRKYKVLLLLDVIEHLPDPWSFLQNLLEGFHGANQVLITVPARAELWSNYDEYYGHFRRYDRPMMRRLAADLGWRVERMSYAFRALYAPAWLLARGNRPRAVDVIAPSGIAIAAHRCLGVLFRVEYALVPRSVAGTTLVCHLTRGPSSGA